MTPPRGRRVASTPVADRPAGAPPDAPAAGLPAPRPPKGPFRRLVNDRVTLFGLVIVSVLLLAALFGPALAPHDPNRISADAFAPPSAHFPLGSDNLGRDMLSRLLFGARLSIGATVVATLLISLIGIVLGMLAGYLGGVVDSVITWVIDVLLAFPSLLLGLAVTAILGPGLGHVTIALVLVWWTGYARIVRAAVLSQRSQVYVKASVSVGATRGRILVRHVLPNILAPIAVYTSLEMGAILLAISALSFLGLGVNPPTAEWGSMLSSAKPYIDVAPQLMILPGAAIFLFALGFNLLGDGLRDALDPRAEGRRA